MKLKKKSRALLLPVLAFVLCVASVPRAAQLGRDETLTTRGGELSIKRVGGEDSLDWELRFAGKSVLSIEGASFVHFEAHFPNLSMGEVVVVSVNSGGNACPAQFRVVRVVGEGKVDVSDEFGDCSDSPNITLKQLPEEEITFGFPGYYQLWQSREPGFRKPPPTAYVYNNKGVLRELKPASRRR
ncbi:MAG TPA: hypothetical protein VJ866_20000 [Pyrinomonadaceae bacterium]|nr:hypothetical protein [Pyrinomonadaceae bacterium]